MNFIAKSMLILLIIALCLGAVAYGVLSSSVKQSGTISLPQQEQASDTRPVNEQVEQIEMNGPFDLDVVQGEKAKLTILGEERLVPKVIIKQDGKVLRIGTTGMLVTKNQTVKVTLVIPKLTAMNQFGSGDCKVEGFSGSQVDLNLNGSGNLSFIGRYQHVHAQSKGSGDIDLDLGNIDQADLIAAGSGDVVAVGKLNKFTAVLTGSGSIDAERLIAQDAEAVSHGAGEIKLYASKVAKVIATGSGDVEIFGNPEQKSISRTGAGTVTSN